MFAQYSEDLNAKNINEKLDTDKVCYAFNSAFLKCNDWLTSSKIDTSYSGSTCIAVIFLG